MTLVALGAVTVEAYRLRTGDRTSSGEDITGAFVENEELLEEELRRLLPLEEREESMVITDCDGRMWPKAYPITACATNTIDGHSLIGGTPSLSAWLGIFDSYSVTPRATITYTGGFDADTLPRALANAIYDLSHADLTDTSLVPVGASSVSVGDVSVTYAGSDAGGSAIDEKVPGLWSRVKKYQRRFV